MRGNQLWRHPLKSQPPSAIAQLSTGPRSEQGKAVSRFNALKTVIQAKSHVIPGEDPAELNQLAANYHRQWHASTPDECFLVDTIVDADWQIRRLRIVEAKLWDHVLASDDSRLGCSYARNLRLSPACTTAAKRSSARTTASLQQLRQLRQSSEDNLIWTSTSRPLRPTAFQANWVRSAAASNQSKCPSYPAPVLARRTKLCAFDPASRRFG
jgi:hypothetical protein